MRVYVPLTLPALEATHRAGESVPEPGSPAAYAVTSRLRAWCGTEDAEELEYAALSCAAEASLRLLAADPEAPRCRVVLAADVPDRAVTEVSSPQPDREPGSGEGEPDPGSVRLAGPVRLTQVAAVHADGDDAAPDVAAAAGATAAADAGDEQAAATADRAADHDLLWFATQEIPDLLARPA